MSRVRARSDVKQVMLGGRVRVGPETAARLGVPAGTVVDLGELAYWHKNPLRRVCWRLMKRLGRR